MRKNADSFSGGHQPEAGIILTEDETTLCPAREHPIWLVRSLCDEIIDQNADVGILTAEDERGVSSNAQCGVDTRHDPLGGSFLVSGRSIDLSSKIEATYSF